MQHDPSVFHKSRVPLYLQVARLMRQKIEKQEWRFGEKIPTLDELEKEYQISRITLRGALDQLELQGIITRRRGLGTFVAKDLSEQRWFRLANTFDELRELVTGLEVRLLPIEEEVEEQLVPAFPYGVPGPAYQRLRRVHYRNDEPYCLIDIYVDKTLFDTDPEGFITAPIVSRLAAHPEVEIGGARQILRIVVSDEDASAHLDIGVGDPIADVYRTILDKNNRIIYYAHIQYPAQMIQVETDLMPVAATPKSGRPHKKHR